MCRFSAVRLQLAMAERRARAAHAEATAEAAEDFARLTPRQRSARRVARLLMAAQPDGLVDKTDAEGDHRPAA